MVHSARADPTPLPYARGEPDKPLLAIVPSSTHAMNFKGRPKSISLKCWTAAEDVPSHEETLILDLHWENMTARFREGNR